MEERPIVLFGYLGGGNLGDDLMLDGMLDVLRDTRRPITILARDPKAVRLPQAITAEIRPAAARAALRAVTSGADVVRVGGTSFHDEYASKNMTGRYLKLAALYILPRLSGGRSFAFGIGAGRMERWITKRLAALSMSACKTVFTRDPASTDTLTTLAPKADIHTGVDLAFLKPASAIARDASILGMSILDLEPYGEVPDGQEAFWNALADAALKAAGDVRTVRLFVFKHNEAESDRPVSERLAERLRARGMEAEIFDQTQDRDRVLEAFAQCGHVVATRYHAGILAAMNGAPILLVRYNDKLARLADDFSIARSDVISPWQVAPESVQFTAPEPSADFVERKTKMADALRQALTGAPS